MNRMTRNEFIKTASNMGYCTKKQAEKYAESRDEFSESDFVEVYEIAQEEEAVYVRHDRIMPFGGRTSKRYFGDTGNR